MECMKMLICHLIGDFWLQTPWMANNKFKENLPAAIHAFLYSIPFLFAFNLSATAYWTILLTHYVIDRYSVGSKLIWLKNYIVDQFFFFEPQPDYKDTLLGMSKETPLAVSFGVYVAAENVLHLIINALSIAYL